VLRRHALNVCLALTCCGALTNCGPNYSPDTYATNAVQQANKVDQGMIVGVRRVAISAAGAVGTITGAAAGGIAGSQVGIGPMAPFTALGGSLIGGIAGSAAEHAANDTDGWEYIVRKPNGDLVSVTQKDEVPLALGQKVLVIAGNQARVVPDYTVSDRATPPKKAATDAPAPGSQEPHPEPAAGKPSPVTAPAEAPAAVPVEAQADRKAEPADLTVGPKEAPLPAPNPAPAEARTAPLTTYPPPVEVKASSTGTKPTSIDKAAPTAIP
jgi:outer membrane lipoprotein SlyB